MKKRMISIVLVLALLVQILPTYVFAENDASDTPPVEAVEMETGAPGKVVLGEMTDRRAEREKHFHLNDGGFVAVDYGAPVHYSTDGGETWNDIDNTLALSRDDAELYVAENGDSVRGFASDLRAGRLLAVSDGAYGLRFGLPETADNADGEKRGAAVAEISYPDEKTRGNEELPFAEQVTPSKLRTEVLYRNVYDGVDLSYVLYSHDVKESILVNRPLESYAFSFTLDTDELTPALAEDGSIELRNADGEVIYLIPAPYMFDADGTESDAVFYKLEEAESGAWMLTVAADAEWINDAERAFPVAIDPSVYFAGNSSNQQIYSGYINDNNPNVHPADSSSYIRCGNYPNSATTAGHSIGLIYVNTLPGIPENSVVTTAILKLFQTSYSNGNTGYYNYPRLYSSQINDPSFSTGNSLSFINSLTWNNFFNKVYYGEGTTLDNRTCIDYTKCKINTLGDHYFEITDPMRKWYDDATDISRLLVLDDGHDLSISSRATFSGYGNGNFGHQPQLIVFYRNTIGVESYYDYHTQSIGRAGTASVNNFTLGLSLSVPLFSAPSQALPFGLSLTYNAPLSYTDFTKTTNINTVNYSTSKTGNGWKSSVQQSVTAVKLTDNEGYQKMWLIYTDADGTEHYFSKKSGSSTEFEDEDGLGLTITVNNSTTPTEFTMKDKETNTWKFYYGYLSSYTDHNGNALYYAYNGYDYSSNETNWRPSNSNTVYRVTSVWRQNSDVSTATKLVTLGYENNRLKTVADTANRPTTLGYDTSSGNLTSITYPDAQTVSYTYWPSTMTNPATGISRTLQCLTKARDNESQYEIRYTYWDGNLLRVKEIQEYTGVVGSEEAGSIMRGFKPTANAALFRYSGADLQLSTEDDLIAHFYFDNWGRPINIASFGSHSDNMLGISVGKFKENSGADKDNNRLTNAASAGLQNVNLLYNSGLEKTSSLYGWNGNGNGSVNVAASASDILPRTGGRMMKLELSNASQNKEACYQTVYLTKDKTYVFSAYVNTAAVSDLGTGGAYLSFRSSSGADIANASSRVLNYNTNTGIDNGWERLEAVFKPAQSGAYQVAVNMTHMAQVVLADDLQLEIVHEPSALYEEARASTASLIQLGGFELPGSSSPNTSEVTNFWEFSTGTENNQSVYRVSIENDPDRGKVIRLDNAPERQVRARQEVTVNAPGNRTYLVSAWGKMPVGYTSDGTNLKYNNATYERFFGIIVEIKYAGYSETEHQYVAFNGNLGTWQYTAGVIAPKHPERTVEKLTVKITGDALPNDAWVDDVTLTQEPVQTYTYDDKGNLVAATNSEGKTSTELDSQDRLSEYTAMNGVVYNLTYEGDSRQPKTIVSDGITTTYDYDAAGNVTETKTQAPNNGIYMESGAAYENAKNFAVSTTDTNGATSQSNYNTAKGLLTKSTDPKGTETNYSYNNDNDRPTMTYIGSTDALIYGYDEKGQLVKLTRGSYLGANSFQQLYHFHYDAWGNTEWIRVSGQIGETDPDATNSIQLASYQYNVNGTLQQMNYPNGDYVLYAYDQLDRLVEEVYYNNSNVVTADYRYVYNPNGQLARQYAVENGVEKESYVFEYDSLGRLIRSREEGANHLVQRTEHLYDQANRLTNQNWVVGQRSFKESYTYNSSDGTMASMQIVYDDANGWNAKDKLTYTYDSLKRLTQVLDTENGSTQFYTRNYVYRDISSDKTTSQLAQFTYRNPSNNNVIYGNRYTYDANGNIKKIEEVFSVNGTDTFRTLAEYEYDVLNQLTKETRNTYSGSSTTPSATTEITYTIDMAGNIRSAETKVNNVIAGTVSYTYGESRWADLLTAYDGHAIAYEGQTINPATGTVTGTVATGNPINWYNGTSYTGLNWTQGRRLESITKGSDTYSYEYDMSGVRCVKIADGLRHEYVTQNGKVVRETVRNASNDAFQYMLDFTYDESGHPLTMRRYYNEAQTSYNTYHYVCNAQGDVVKLVHGANTTVAEYSYDAWGNILTATGSLANVNPLRYRGYYFDIETGFYYLQSRYYDPIVKRFLNADSYGSTGQGFLGYNMFAYCENNPEICTDPSGNRPIWEQYEGGCVGYTDSESKEHVYSNGPVTLTVTSSKITIDAYMKFIGPMDSSKLINGIKEYWEGNYSIAGMNRHLEINIHEGYNPAGDTITVYSYMSFGRSNTASKWKGNKTSRIKLYVAFNMYSPTNIDYTIAHEFGHCLGIGDYYAHVDAGEPGYKRRFVSIMNKTGMRAQSVDVMMVLLAFRSGVWQDWKPE